MSVILGKADAGATLDVYVSHASSETSELLRPLMTTDEISPHPLSAHPRLPETVRLAFAEAMLRLGADSSGEELLRTVRMPFPVTADYGRDYQGIEEIDIRTLAQEE